MKRFQILRTFREIRSTKGIAIVVKQLKVFQQQLPGLSVESLIEYSFQLQQFLTVLIQFFRKQDSLPFNAGLPASANILSISSPHEKNFWELLL